MSAKIAAEVTYQKAHADVTLEYDSKNKEPAETITVSEVFTSTMVFNKTYTDSVTLAEEILISTQYNLAFTESISSSDTFAWTTVQNLTDAINTGDTPAIGQIYHVNPTENVTVSDLLATYQDGMLNTNMFNTRLISAGSTEILVDDVTIT